MNEFTNRQIWIVIACYESDLVPEFPECDEEPIIKATYDNYEEAEKHFNSLRQLNEGGGDFCLSLVRSIVRSTYEW